jgi:hypothetical protein
MGEGQGKNSQSRGKYTVPKPTSKIGRSGESRRCFNIREEDNIHIPPSPNSQQHNPTQTGMVVVVGSDRGGRW